jgi:hypothetical protein
MLDTTTKSSMAKSRDDGSVNQRNSKDVLSAPIP